MRSKTNVNSRQVQIQDKCKRSANARQKHLLKVATLSVQLAAIVILYSLRLWEGGVADVIGGGRFEYVFGMKRRKHLYLTLKGDDKEQMVETRGQTKSLHGKPFPTASQFQGRSRFEEGW